MDVDGFIVEVEERFEGKVDRVGGSAGLREVSRAH